MADDAEAAALAAARAAPLATRTGHKLWRARCEAYDAMADACRGGGALDDEVVDLIVAGAADTNAAAQDKALDALVAFLSRPGPPCPVAARVAPAASAALATKALKGRPATVGRATDAALLLVEHGAGAAVTAAMVAALGDKVPKVPAAALGVLSAAATAYGPTALDLPALFSALPPVFEARAAPVREAAKKLAADLAAGLGMAAVGPALLARVPDAARKDVERAVSAGGGGGGGGPAAPTRQTRAAAAAAAAAASGGGGDVDMADAASAPAAPAAPPPAIDAFSLAAPTDLVPALGKAFHAGLASAKWSDRRAALQKLTAAASAPLLAPGCAALPDAVRELRKVLATDANAACVAEAAAAVGALGAGLRRDFAAPARVLVPALLDKLKDKNAGVAAAAAAGARALLTHCVPLADAADDVAAALASKNPATRAAALRVLAAVAADTAPPPTLVKAVLPTLLPAAAKAAADAVPDVRDAAVSALAAMCAGSGLGGCALLDRLPLGAALDAARRKKVETALAGGGGGGGGAAAGPRRPGTARAAAAAAAPAAPAARPALSPRSANVPASSSSSSSAAVTKPPGRAGPGGVRAGPPARRPAAAALPGASSSAPPTTTTTTDNDDHAPALTRADAEDRLASLLGPAKAADLASPDWKVRLAAMDALAAAAGGCDGGPGPYTGPADLVQCLAHVPGWADKNFQVLARAFHVLAAAAGATTPPFTRRDAAVVVDGAAEKLADAKVRAAAAAALDAAAEAVGPSFVASRLHARAAAARNPRVLAEADAWIGRAVTEFGVGPAAGWDVRALVAALKGDLGAATPGVRSAAVAALAALHAHLGPALAEAVRADVKPALMATLDAAFAAAPAGSAPAPVRAVRGAAAVVAAAAQPPPPVPPAPAARAPSPARPSPPVRAAAVAAATTKARSPSPGIAAPPPPRRPSPAAPPPPPPPAVPCLAAAPGKDARLRAAARGGAGGAGAEAAILADLVPLASPELAALLTTGSPSAAADAAALVAGAVAAGGRSAAGAVAASDLLLRWAAVRLGVAAPPAHARRFIDLATAVFRALGSAGGRLARTEADAVLPALVAAGVVVSNGGGEALRSAALAALAAATAVAPPALVLDALTSVGLGPGTAPGTRTEALAALADLVQAGAAGGLGGGGGGPASTKDPPPPFARVAAAASSDPDPGVREAALDALALLVAVEGPAAAWAAAGPMAPDVRAAVEGRAGGGPGGGAAAAPPPAAPVAPAAPAAPPPRPPPPAVTAPARPPPGPAPRPPSPSAFRAADTPAAARRPNPLLAAGGGAPTPLPPPTPGAGTPTPPGLTPGVALVRRPAAPAPAPPPPPRPPSPPFTADDPVAAWAAALTDMASPDLGTAVEGMKAACYEMMDAAAAVAAAAAQQGGGPTTTTLTPALAAMVASADVLVAGLAARTGQAFSLALSDAAAAAGGGLRPPPPSTSTAQQQQPRGVRAAKYVLNALLQAFDLPPVGRAVGAPALRDAAGALLNALLDAPALPTALGPDGSALVKALNVLMLRLLAGADKARAVDALLALLARPPPAVAARPVVVAAPATSTPPPPPPPPPADVFADLVVKCLIKLARTLAVGGGSGGGAAPPTLDPAVDPAALLASAHAWFEASAGGGAGGGRAAAPLSPTDRRVRAVQTLVHEVCRLTPGGPTAVRAALARGVPGCATAVPPPAIVAAVEANLAALAGGGGPAPATTSSSPAPPPSPSAELASIFRLIGARESSEAGLDALARFVAARPPGGAVDLGPHLAKTSPHFQAYIAAGLARAAGRLGLGPLPACGVGTAAVGEAVLGPAAAPPPPAPAAATSLEALRARLERVRLAGGGGGGGRAPSSAAAAAPPPPASTEALQARMQALRRGGGV